MGYIHDTNMLTFISPRDIAAYGGVWYSLADGDHWYMQRDAVAGTFNVMAHVAVPVQNSTTKRGSKVASVDIYYSIFDAALTSLEARVWMQALPASGAFAEPVAQTFTYDSAHNSAGERITAAGHVMTVTLDVPTWIEGSEYLRVQLVGVAGAAAITRIWGVRIHYTLRV